MQPPARAAKSPATENAPLPVQERTWRPSQALAPFVESYSLRDERMGGLQVYNPLSARTDCFLQFYLADTYQVVSVASGAMHLAPRCVLVGPHTRRREDLLCTGHLKRFTIRFSAIGFRALFAIPARLIRDLAESAHLVLGADVLDLESRLAYADESTLAAIAESWLLSQLARSQAAPDGGVVARIVRVIEARHGCVAVRDVSASYGLSARQVERAFLEHVGIPPKVYGRLTRLRLALGMSAAAETQDWADTAVSAGYFDQSHMVRDFRAFNGVTPLQFLALRRRIPAP